MNKIAIFPILSIFFLSGCSTPKPMSWGEKELKYGLTCEKEGLGRGSPEYLVCIAESYHEDTPTSQAREKTHNGSGSSVAMPWEKHRNAENRVSHSYGRSENSSPDIPIINKGVNW